MPVCLHCGELSDDGTLFCPKCGYTLPQTDPSVKPTAAPSGGVAAAAIPVAAPSPAAAAGVQPMAVQPTTIGWTYAPVGYAMMAPPPVPGAVGPIPPPPAGKYCIRCGALISRVAAYCPVCQQPQV